MEYKSVFVHMLFFWHGADFPFAMVVFLVHCQFIATVVRFQHKCAITKMQLFQSDACFSKLLVLTLKKWQEKAY